MAATVAVTMVVTAAATADTAVADTVDITADTVVIAADTVVITEADGEARSLSTRRTSAESKGVPVLRIPENSEKFWTEQSDLREKSVFLTSETEGLKNQRIIPRMCT